jgi:transcription antitermination factor NusG
MHGTEVSVGKGAKPAVVEAAAIEPAPASQWFAIWTRSHCEQLVMDQLRERGFAVFLPRATVWSRRGRTRRRIAAPLFPGYLFLHHALDREAHVEVIKARGVVSVLGDGLDRVTPVPDPEIERLQRLTDADVPVFPFVGFNNGDPVRIVAGPLASLEGTFVRGRPDKGLFVVSVSLLQRHVAVEVNCVDVQKL